MVADAVGVAVVGQPRREDRVARGDEAAGQTQVEVVEHVQELVRALVDFGEGVAHEQHVGRRVLAGRRGHAAGQADPAPDARQAEAGVVDRAAEPAPQHGRAAHVHPEDGVHQRPALAVDRHRALALGRAADGGDLGGGGRAAAQQPPGRRHKAVPPVVGALLGAPTRQHVQGDRLALPADHETLDRDQGDLDPGRAQVDGQDAPVHGVHELFPACLTKAPSLFSERPPGRERSIAPGGQGARRPARLPPRWAPPLADTPAVGAWPAKVPTGPRPEFLRREDDARRARF